MGKKRKDWRKNFNYVCKRCGNKFRTSGRARDHFERYGRAIQKIKRKQIIILPVIKISTVLLSKEKVRLKILDTDISNIHKIYHLLESVEKGISYIPSEIMIDSFGFKESDFSHSYLKEEAILEKAEEIT